MFAVICVVGERWGGGGGGGDKLVCTKYIKFQSWSMETWK